MAQPHVFLSHSSRGAAFTRQLEDALHQAGATVYRVSADQGGDFLKCINEALLACQWVVLVLTTDALASPWVEQEIHAALALKNQRRIQNILPIQAGAVDYRAIPPLWGVYNIFDASRDYAAGRDGLLRALGLPVPSASPPVAQRPIPPPPAQPTSASPLPAGRGAGGEDLPSRLAQLGFSAHRAGNIEYILPPLCAVAAGEFLMGSDPAKDKQLFGDEKPQHTLNLPGFQIARFPTTVAEYACFVRSGQKAPNNWQQQLGKLDHPVVSVSWHDAVAYAAWLKQQTGQPWRLPSEAEWEKAARGADGRIYPWGDSFDKTHCNTSESGKGGTTPVGSYTNGGQPLRRARHGRQRLGVDQQSLQVVSIQPGRR